MSNYDFYHIFEPMEFQRFACAVISKRENCSFQRFGAGPDGGIDGFYEDDKGNYTILQVKRTAAKGKTLLNLIRQEHKHMTVERCDRYILVLSVNSISWNTKEEIQRIFPEIISTNDIITGEDLNGYLECADFTEIERAYPKLWLQSGNQLETILSKAMSMDIISRTRVRLRYMEEELKTFVASQVYYDALKVLDQYRRVIISGEPGMGKTIHAYCLGRYYLKKCGYEQLYFVNSLDEIERIMGEENGKKTVFIFDDFWGHNRFSESRLGLNAERKLEELFDVMRFYPDTRLIFTTREFVLQQGLFHFTELAQRLTVEKVNLNLSTYSLAQKAEIFYRHLEASNLEYAYVEEVFKHRLPIINCEAYSPRSITYFLKSVPIGELNPKEYAENLELNVRSPQTYFNEIFKNLSYGARLICIILLISDGGIRIDIELRKSFMAMMEEGTGKEHFEEYLRELEGTFTEIKENEFESFIETDFLNHSIRDFIWKYLIKHIEAFEEILVEKSIYFNQLYYLLDDVPITDESKNKVIERLMVERDKLKYTYTDNFNIDLWEYDVNADPSQYKFYKIWSMLLIYEKEKESKPELYPKLYQYLTEICDDLLQTLFDDEPTKEEMEQIIDLIPRMVENGYKVDGKRLIARFYENIHWSNELALFQCLRTCAPKIFDVFWDEHIEEMRERLPWLLLDDVEYLIEDAEYGEVDQLLIGASDMFEKFGIPYTKAYERKLYRMAERDRYKGVAANALALDKKKSNQTEKDKQSYQDVTERANERLLPRKLWISSKQIEKMLIELGSNFLKTYLVNGNFTIDDFLLVVEYLEREGEAPKTESLFYKGIITFLTEDMEENEKKELSSLAKQLMLQNIFFFSESFFRNQYKEAESYGLLDELMNIGLLHRDGKWYSFWNKAFLMNLVSDNIGFSVWSTKKNSKLNLCLTRRLTRRRLLRWIYEF